MVSLIPWERFFRSARVRARARARARVRARARINRKKVCCEGRYRKGSTDWLKKTYEIFILYKINYESAHYAFFPIGAGGKRRATGQATPLTGRGNSVQGPHYKRGHLLLRCTDAHLQPGINSTQTIAKIQPCLHLKYSSFLCLNNFQIRATDIKIMLLPLSSKPSLPLAIPAYIILCCTARARQTWSRSRLRRDSRLTIDISNWDGTNSMQANILTALIILPPSYSAVELRTAAISEDLLAIGSLCNSLISLS